MNKTSPFLSILFPAHNEEMRLPRALQLVDAYIQKQTFACELVIIENGSQDATLSIAQDFARAHDYAQVIHEDQPGKGRAVQKGMAAAKGDYRFICDVDLSMPVDEINHFLPPQPSNYDIAIATREGPGAVRYGEPFYRHLVGRVFNFMVQAIVLHGINDTQCGFKCFSAQAADALFPMMTMYGWSFDVEILAIARQRKMRIVEIPIPWYYQPNSKIHVLKDSFRMAKDLLEIRGKLDKGQYARQD